MRWLLGGELHPGGARTTRRALELVEAAPGERLLDVASGGGDSALLAARERGCVVAGVEYGHQAVLAAQAEAQAAGLSEQVGFVHGDAEELPFDDAAFDLVLCECSLCTFADKEQAMAEIARVLRPGGRLALCDVVVEAERLPVALTGTLAEVACIGAALSLDGLRELLASSGFDLLAVEGRREDALAMARAVEDRLRGARLLGWDASAMLPGGLEEAVELVRLAQVAIADGTLDYALCAAERR